MSKMRKKMAVLIVAFTVLFTATPAVVTPMSTEVSAKIVKVYIASQGGAKYHSNKKCRALSRSVSIKRIRRKRAKLLGYKKCKICGAYIKKK